MELRHDEFAWFIEAVGDIERLIQSTISAMVIFMIVAVGVYIISQLLERWRSRVLESRLTRHRHPANPVRVDTWRESGARLRNIDDNLDDDA